MNQKPLSLNLKSSRSKKFFKIGVLKNFAILTGKHLSWSYFLIKLQVCRSTILVKRDSSTGGEVIKDTFFTGHLPRAASEIRTVSFLRIFVVSLDKSALLHHRCLMSQFTEMLMLVCSKIFSAFYPTWHVTFSNSYGFALLQKFNPLYSHLVLYDRKHFCSILTNLSHL